MIAMSKLIAYNGPYSTGGGARCSGALGGAEFLEGKLEGGASEKGHSTGAGGITGAREDACRRTRGRTWANGLAL